MSATVATIKAALHTAFQTALPPSECIYLDAPPTSLHTQLTLFTELDRFDRGVNEGPARGQLVPMRYFFNHFLFVPLQETQTAETLIDTYVNPLCAAIDADSRLGGLIDQGIARIVQGETGYVTVNGTTYRVLTLVSDVLHKFAYRTAGL